MDIRQEVMRAEERIRPDVRETFLEPSPYYSQLGGAEVYCKLENLQYTGSFKFRGALNKLRSLTRTQRKAGVVTASTGNHGLAVARSARLVGTSGIVYVPETAPASKVEAITREGAEVRHHGTDCVETEVHARRYAQRQGKTYVSPYNDPQVIGGQGTVGVELARQLGRIDVLFASVGGGGLISGVAGYLKSRNPAVRVVGCSPEASPVMIESVRAGRILELPSRPTLSDGTAGV